jgi:hypothetical protein
MQHIRRFSFLIFEQGLGKHVDLDERSDWLVVGTCSGISVEVPCLNADLFLHRLVTNRTQFIKRAHAPLCVIPIFCENILQVLRRLLGV